MQFVEPLMKTTERNGHFLVAFLRLMGRRAAATTGDTNGKSSGEADTHRHTHRHTRRHTHTGQMRPAGKQRWRPHMRTDELPVVSFLPGASCDQPPLLPGAPPRANQRLHISA